MTNRTGTKHACILPPCEFLCDADRSARTTLGRVMAVPAAPDARELSTFLLDLHRRSHELDYRAMQRFGFERLRALVQLDGGLFAVGTLQNGVPQVHDVFLFDKPPELMASWDAIKTEDRLAFVATASPNTTINISASGPLYDGCERVREHCKR